MASEEEMREAAEVQPRHRTSAQRDLAAQGIAAGFTSVKNADYHARRHQSANLPE